MAWELRGNRLYYYRSRRLGKHVMKEYFGAGLAAHLAAAEDEDRRRRRQERRDELVRVLQSTAQSVAPHDQVDVLTSALMKASLRDAGYHQHDRGEWRKRRVSPGG